jgi:apolipoprotein N-acyltransferase
MMSGLAIGYGFLWTLPYLTDRWLVRWLRGFSSTLVYPLAATTLEFLNIHTNPVGMWGATGFTQYGNLQLMQLASVTGMIGITFLMGWFASVTNWAWEERGRGREVRRGLAAFGTILLVVLAFGFARLNMAPISGTEETVRVAGITAKSTYEAYDLLTADLQAHRDAYFGETVREAQAGAAVVLWPEIAGFGLASDEASLINRAEEVARQNGIYLALPLFTGPDDLSSGQLPVNKLLLIDPTGTIVLEHVKYGGQVFEIRQQGDGRLQTVDTPFGVLSGAICYDMDYPAIVQQSGLKGTGLMLVPSKDWYEIDPIHTHMIVFRAIENGMSLVRQTDAGLSMAIDPYGRVLAQTDFFGATDRTMVAQVPVKHVTTIYTLFGRWLEWLAPTGLINFIGWVLILRRQER